MSTKNLLLTFFLFMSCALFAQKDGDVIINEIGNHGTKKTMYTGGDYIELLIVNKAGVNLAGWYLTDLSSPNGTAKETEGSIKFSNKEGSVFNQTLPQGTYVLICFGSPDITYGRQDFKESTELKEGENKIVVFTECSQRHIEKISGSMDLAGKDNIALLSNWNKHAAVDIVTWSGASTCDGAEGTSLTMDMVENGEIIYFTNGKKNFQNNSDASSWVSASDAEAATPGSVNTNVDDSSLHAK